MRGTRLSKHHVDHHGNEMQWSNIVEIILTTKNKRKKGQDIEIETDRYYLLCELKDNVLWVINAKVTK